MLRNALYSAPKVAKVLESKVNKESFPANALRAAVATSLLFLREARGPRGPKGKQAIHAQLFEQVRQVPDQRAVHVKGLFALGPLWSTGRAGQGRFLHGA